MHPHEIEEIEHRFGPRMWDATPGVCCAYFQTGACSHTEAYDGPTDDELAADEGPDWDYRFAAWSRPAPADEPF